TRFIYQRIADKAFFHNIRYLIFCVFPNLNSTYLITATDSEMFYVFPIRNFDNSNWLGTIYFNQDDLYQLVRPKNQQLLPNSKMRIYFSIDLNHSAKIVCKKIDISSHWGRNGWLKYWK
ncbi:MAG: hypothetical protein ACI86H_002578, partial [bacterium]